MYCIVNYVYKMYSCYHFKKITYYYNYYIIFCIIIIVFVVHIVNFMEVVYYFENIINYY